MDIDSALDTPRDGGGAAPATPAAAAPIAGSDAEMVESGENEMQVRTMEIPRWLSTPGKSIIMADSV